MTSFVGKSQNDKCQITGSCEVRWIQLFLTSGFKLVNERCTNFFREPNSGGGDILFCFDLCLNLSRSARSIMWSSMFYLGE